MKVEGQNQSFKGMAYNAALTSTAFLDKNALANKGLFDLVGSDIPWIIMANNKEERRERVRRNLLSFVLIFASPLLALPFANGFAMKSIAKLTDKFFSKQFNAIRLSNKDLMDADKTKLALEKLSKEFKIDKNKLLEKADGSYDVLRKKIINAKNSVLALDFLLIMASFGNIGFINNYLTKKRTGQSGYSAEFNMADKEIVEKRAEKNKKLNKIKFLSYMALTMATVTGLPLAIRHGLLSKKSGKVVDKIQKYAEKFDYTDLIFMKRLPLFISMVGVQLGICAASRNKTELKDNAIRASMFTTIFFGGDLLMSSLLGNLSDKLFATKLRKEGQTSKLSKILPSIKSMEELKTLGHNKSLNMGMGIFWLNFIGLAALIGFGIPKIINKMIKKDVSEDAKKAQGLNNVPQNHAEILAANSKWQMARGE